MKRTGGDSLPLFAASLLVFGGLNLAAIFDVNAGYVVDSSKQAYQNPYGECWQDSWADDGSETPPECADWQATSAVARPDDDGDGIENDSDRCPGTPAGVRVDTVGCPIDSDRDGVPDYQDQCLGTPSGASVDARGCEVQKVEKVVIDDKVLFDFDSAELRPEASRILDGAYRKYKGSPAVQKVVISGHTCSIGTEEYNRQLSERRANAVRDYLIGKGARASVLEARGMGESEPAASNDTDEGRQQNRRVEFEVILKE